jgi:glucokinase
VAGVSHLRFSMNITRDPRTVLTLDAGGTSFRFSAFRSGAPTIGELSLPAEGDHLDHCLANLHIGFATVLAQCPEPPVAISFAFPGPANYARGIIGDAPNLPSFRGGVALGPWLEEKFGLPVFINNDGDLFALGEALGGLLPAVNDHLRAAGSSRRYRNLLGLTLGTGLGGGMVRNGELVLGDNGMASEIWSLRSHRLPSSPAEEELSIRAVRRGYAERAGIDLASTPEPRLIHAIALGHHSGIASAARETFESFGESLGELLCDLLPMIDGVAVIGGGLAAAYPLFIASTMKVLRGEFTGPPGSRTSRLVQTVFDLSDSHGSVTFARDISHCVTLPASVRKIEYDPIARLGLAPSRLGTSRAIQLGAYAFALQRLDQPASVTASEALACSTRSVLFAP